MKINLCLSFVGLIMVAGVYQAASQELHFFRISGPSATQITAFRSDGMLVWTNARSGTNYTVQTTDCLRQNGTNWVDYVQIPVLQNINTNQIIALKPPAGMAFIPAGSFTMGDSLDGQILGELPLHTVYVSAIYMDQGDVTVDLWQQVRSWAVAHGYGFDSFGNGPYTNHPAVTVNWYDCVKWCNARSELEGRMPAYYTSGAQTNVYRTGDLDISTNCVKWTAGYRLPTEAEWEKAARGGLCGKRFPWGNTISETQASYYSSTNRSYDLSNTGYNPTYSSFTSPVGAFPANGYGLYDMAGNVNQWCWDWYGNYYSNPQSDPRGPSSGTSRTFRGGSFGSDAFYCRTAERGFLPANTYNYGIGFRTILPLGQ